MVIWRLLQLTDRWEPAGVQLVRVPRQFRLSRPPRVAPQDLALWRLPGFRQVMNREVSGPVILRGPKQYSYMESPEQQLDRVPLLYWWSRMSLSCSRRLSQFWPKRVFRGSHSEEVEHQSSWPSSNLCIHRAEPAVQFIRVALTVLVVRPGDMRVPGKAVSTGNLTLDGWNPVAMGGNHCQSH